MFFIFFYGKISMKYIEKWPLFWLFLDENVRFHGLRL
uniref:Uncharacterized protein n=1 Tax=Rhizophora mucronata TaxID=61149 RepID=A0A2P2IRJ2_RHIMU